MNIFDWLFGAATPRLQTENNNEKINSTRLVMKDDLEDE